MTVRKHGWVFSQVPIWATCDPRISDGAHRLLTYLVYRQGTNPDAWPSVGSMANDLGVSEDTIRRRIKELEACGYAIVTHRPGQSNRYRMEADPGGASQKYHPDLLGDGGLAEVQPPANLRPHPPQICDPTPRKSATQNDSHEREITNDRKTRDVGTSRPRQTGFADDVLDDEQTTKIDTDRWDDIMLRDKLAENTRARTGRNVRGIRTFQSLEQKRVWRDAVETIKTVNNGTAKATLEEFIRKALVAGRTDRAGVINYVAACARNGGKVFSSGTSVRTEPTGLDAFDEYERMMGWTEESEDEEDVIDVEYKS